MQKDQRLVQTYEPFEIYHTFDKIKMKILEIQFQLDIITYISDDTKPHFISAVKESHLFYASYRNASRIIMIDIVKLLDERENNNLRTFIDNLYTDFKIITWSTTPKTVELDEINKKLLKIKGSHHYKLVRDIRRKFIAHDAHDKHKFNKELANKDLFWIVHEVKDIYNMLSHFLLDSTHSFDIYNNFAELESLHRYHLICDELEKFRKVNRELGVFKSLFDLAFNPIEDA